LAWALNLLSINKLRAYKADTYRHAVERMEPSWYGNARYYERMLTGVTTLLVEQGVVSLEELERRAGGRVPVSNPVAQLPVLQTEHSETPEARFSPGDVAPRMIAGGNLRERFQAGSSDLAAWMIFAPLAAASDTRPSSRA